MSLARWPRGAWKEAQKKGRKRRKERKRRRRNKKQKQKMKKKEKKKEKKRKKRGIIYFFFFGFFFSFKYPRPHPPPISLLPPTNQLENYVAVGDVATWQSYLQRESSCGTRLAPFITLKFLYRGFVFVGWLCFRTKYRISLSLSFSLFLSFSSVFWSCSEVDEHFHEMRYNAL